MKNQEIKSNMKNIRNRIILNNLSEKQKEGLMKSGIIGGGLVSGLFMFYSMKDPETIPGLLPDATMVNDLHESSTDEFSNSIEIMSSKPVTEISDQNLPFGEAFKMAREICGAGGWFIWKGNIYNTYYKEEWQALSQDERNDYLASVEINNIHSDKEQHITDTIKDDSQKEIIASDDDLNVDNELVSKVQENEFSVDLRAYNVLKTDTDENLSAKSNELINAEIITLDDDTDIIENGYFELPDDLEITSISEEESSMIDNLTFDSSELTSFPWETSETAAENEILTTEIENIPVDLIEDSNEQIADNAGNNTSHIISNPEEIKEYPWGEPMENSDQNTEISNSETIIQEVEEKMVQNQTEKLHEIEEYPWGEKIEANENAKIIMNENEVSNLDEENIGVILPEEPETNYLSQLPPSFNEITEFPWGEIVPHSQVDPYTSPENDLFKNPTNQLPSFLDDNE
jgi:hypothetical protein